MVCLIRVFRKSRAHQLLGDLGKHRGRRNRRIKRHRARHRAQVGEADTDGNGSTRPGLCPKPAADPVRKMAKRG